MTDKLLETRNITHQSMVESIWQSHIWQHLQPRGKKEPENCCQCMNEAGLITILLCRNENVWNRNYFWFFILNLTFASIILHLQREKQTRIQSLMHCQCWDFLCPYYSRACRVITREIFSTWTHISIQFQFRFQLQNITTQRAFSKVFLSYSDMAVSQT